MTYTKTSVMLQLIRNIILLSLLFVNQFVKAQLNSSLSYSNRSIAYYGAQLISGFNADFMYKSKKNHYYGIEICINSSKVLKKDAYLLGRHEQDAQYNFIYFSDYNSPIDSSLIYKSFIGRLSYTYFNVSYKNFHSISKKQKGEHFLGHNIGINFLTEKIHIKDDSSAVKKTITDQSLGQLMVGINYQYVRPITTNGNFVFGIQTTFSFQPFRVYDFSGISSPLLSLNLQAGYRIFFNKN